MAKARNKIRLQAAEPGDMGVRWLTTGQAAQYFGVSSKTISKWVDEGRLKGIRLPGSLDRRIHPEAVMEFERWYGFDKARGARKEGG